MRQVEPRQLQLGQTDIAKITFDSKSRDDIPQLLRGLQYIYINNDVKNEIFTLLKKLTPENIDPNNGRPGMDLWVILVMGVLRLNLNWDYDRLHEMVNHHDTIRQMLGHGIRDADYRYNLQTLKDNVGLLTAEVINEINVVVVKSGHKALKKTRKLKRKM